MKKLKKFAPVLSCFGWSWVDAQVSPLVSIDVGEVPYVGIQRENRLATITISERESKGLRNGNFVLTGPAHREVVFEFLESTSVSGSVDSKSPFINQGHRLIILVDADDDAIDSITITADMSIHYKSEYRDSITAEYLTNDHPDKGNFSLGLFDGGGIWDESVDITNRSGNYVR